MRNKTKRRAQRCMAKFINYMRGTWKIKLTCIAMMCLSAVPLIDGNATAFVVVSMFAVPAFFMNKPCDDED